MKIFIILFMALCISYSTYAQEKRSDRLQAKFNPAFGVNALILNQNSTRDSDSDGMSLQELELQFSADVDAYFRAQAIIGIHQEAHEEEEEGEEEEHEEGHASYSVDPEEVFVETIALPNISLKMGKFYSSFSKYNMTHAHARPFIYKSTLQENMLGHEGFSSTGLAVSYLLPIGWFSDVTVEVLEPNNEELFEESKQASVYVANWKNLWELSSDLTMELGLSGMSYRKKAPGDDEEASTILSGADLTFKWRPSTAGSNSAIEWSTEFIQKVKEHEEKAENAGLSSFVKYQFSKFQFVQYRYENLGIERTDGEYAAHVNTFLYGYKFSEFSAIRFQFDHIDDDQDEVERRAALQLNFSIGAHPAHRY